MAEEDEDVSRDEKVSKYKILHKAVRKVQLDLHQDTKFCVVTGAIFIFVLGFLFLVIRVRALDGIFMTEVIYAARNTLTHELGVPAFIIDVESRILDINQAASASFGVEKAHVLGMYISEILVYEQNDSNSDDRNMTLPTGRKACGVHRTTGKKLQFVAHTIRLREIDGSERYTIICHDTTTSYELEIQKKVCIPHQEICTTANWTRQVLSQFCHEARNKHRCGVAIK